MKSIGDLAGIKWMPRYALIDYESETKENVMWGVFRLVVEAAILIVLVVFMFHEPILERRYKKMSDKNQVNPYDAGTATPFPDQAKKIVKWYHNNRVDSVLEPENNKITLGDIYVVWFAKTLQNWKALVSTTRADGRYYEVTFNGDKNEYYVDCYEKQDNMRLLDYIAASIFDS